VWSADIESLADLRKSIEFVPSMRIAPFTMESMLLPATATLAPITPLALTMTPLEEPLKKLFGILFWDADAR